MALDLLDNWPTDGRPDRFGNLERSIAFAESIGWIDRVDVVGKCEGCGENRAQYAYHMITPAGHAARDLRRIFTERAGA